MKNRQHLTVPYGTKLYGTGVRWRIRVDDSVELDYIPTKLFVIQPTGVGFYTVQPPRGGTLVIDYHSRPVRWIITTWRSVCRGVKLI